MTPPKKRNKLQQIKFKKQNNLRWVVAAGFLVGGWGSYCNLISGSNILLLHLLLLLLQLVLQPNLHGLSIVNLKQYSFNSNTSCKYHLKMRVHVFRRGAI